MRRPDILVRDILRWEDAYFAHWGRWPTRESGSVSGQIDKCGDGRPGLSVNPLRRQLQ